MFWVCAGLAAWSLLTFFPAPLRALWVPALVATEWGHWLAVLTFGGGIALWLGYPAPRLKAEALLLFFTAFLFITPTLRAQRAARALQLPFSWGRLWLPFSSFRSVSKQTLNYGPSPGQVLDLYVSDVPSTKPKPLIVMVHGGSWRSGSRDELTGWGKRLARDGAVVAMMDYRLAPDAHFPDPIQDVRSAVTFLKTTLQELSVPTQRLFLFGRSAGGQIALTAAYTAPLIQEVSGVISLYAPTDLEFAWQNPGNPFMVDTHTLLRAYLSGSLEEQPVHYRAASPLYNVTARTPPTLLIHGQRDEIVWRGHTDRLEGALIAMQRPISVLRLPWATHGCDANLNGPSGQLIQQVIEEFLRTN